MKDTKYIHKTKNNKYIIRKWDKETKKNYAYGVYETLTEAQNKRDKLILSDFDIELANNINNKKDKYIYLNHGGLYEIRKKINYVNYYFGSFDTLAEAIATRDELEAKNWKTNKNRNRTKRNTNKRAFDKLQRLAIAYQRQHNINN